MTSAVATQFLPVVAAAGAAQNLTVISVHDVAPSSQAIAEKIISELGHRGVRVCSLLVVPDYHHQGPAMKDRQFVSWLRDLESAGHEIVIHGYFHERPRGRAETWAEKFLTRFYTDDEGEFYDLGYEEAFRRITAARDEFLAGGLQDLKRARVFGRPTPGAALPSRILRLPNGDRLQYVIADYVSASGKRPSCIARIR